MELRVRFRSQAMERKVTLVAPDDGRPVVLWDDVRYLLEYYYGLHRGSTRAVHQSYIAGMFASVFQCSGGWRDEHRLMSLDHIAPGSSLVLYRRTMPAALTRYVPMRFTTKERAEEEEEKEEDKKENENDEDALLQQVMVTTPFASSSVPAKKKARHPGDYELNSRGHPLPGDTYTCDECGVTADHFRVDCPRYVCGDDEVQPKPKKKRPATGIPVAKATPVVLVAEKKKHVVVVKKGLFDFEQWLAEQDAAEEEKDGGRCVKKLQSMCTHWLRGLCQKKPRECEYIHQYNVDLMPICSFFLHKTCGKGDECAFRHVLPPSSRNVKPCLAYAMGFCERGAQCDQPHVKRTVPSRADFGVDNDILFEFFVKTMV